MNSVHRDEPRNRDVIEISKRYAVCRSCSMGQNQSSGTQQDAGQTSEPTPSSSPIDMQQATDLQNIISRAILTDTHRIPSNLLSESTLLSDPIPNDQTSVLAEAIKSHSDSINSHVEAIKTLLEAPKPGTLPKLQSVLAVLRRSKDDRSEAMRLRVEEQNMRANSQKIAGHIRDEFQSYKTLHQYGNSQHDLDLQVMKIANLVHHFFDQEMDIKRVSDQRLRADYKIQKWDLEMLQLLEYFSNGESTVPDSADNAANEETDSDSSSTSEPSRPLNPTLRKYYDRLGDLRNYKDSMHNLISEHDRQREQRRELRLADEPVSPSDGPFFDEFYRNYWKIETPLNKAKADVQALKRECEQSGNGIPKKDVFDYSSGSSVGATNSVVNFQTKEHANNKKFHKFYYERFGAIVQNNETTKTPSLHTISRRHGERAHVKDRVPEWLSHVRKAGPEPVDLYLRKSDSLDLATSTQSPPLPSPTSSVGPSLSVRSIASRHGPSKTRVSFDAPSSITIKKRWSMSALLDEASSSGYRNTLGFRDVDSRSVTSAK